MSKNSSISLYSRSDLFVSKEAELVFYLLFTEGVIRSNFLGVVWEHYINMQAAYKWYDDLRKQIPFNQKNEYAHAILYRLYEEISAGTPRI